MRLLAILKYSCNSDLKNSIEGFAKAIVFKIPHPKNINNDGMFLIGAVFVVACGVIIPIILNEKVFKKYTATKLLFGLK